MRGARSVIAFFNSVSKIVAGIAAMIAIALAVWGGSQLGQPASTESTEAPAACSDGRDNDKDGKTDFAGGDPGCRGPEDRAERDAAGGGGGAACSDGRDNDKDGKTDFAGGDPGCTGPEDRAERE